MFSTTSGHPNVHPDTAFRVSIVALTDGRSEAAEEEVQAGGVAMQTVA